MKKYLFLGTFIFAFPCWIKAQGINYAGPDVPACQGSGASIGNSNPGDVCYTWDAADGLNANDIHSFNPTVRPKFKTVYKVHVTGNNFSFSTTDEVEVEVDYGGLMINPSYIKLGGPLENQATAEVKVNNLPEGGGKIIWTIPNAGSTGCAIDSNGVIYGCMQDAEVLVRATSTNYPDCYTQETLHINGGIKEVSASDNSNEGRTAKNGQTLYLVGPMAGSPTNTVNFKALANENSSFPSGQPSWTGSFTAPGNIPTWDSPPLNVGSYTESAGVMDPKSVNVSVVNPNEVSATFGVNTEAVEILIAKLKGNTRVKETDAHCSEPFDYSSAGALTVSYKEVNVPQYHDPNYATKKEVSADLPVISVTGCVYFPCCTGGAAFGPFFVYYFTYLSATIGINVNVAASKDPSTATGDKWMFSNASAGLAGGVEAGLRVESEFGGNAGFIGGVNLSTEAKLECKYTPTPDRLEWNLSYGGLVGKINGALWFGTPDTVIGVGYQRSFLPGSETGFQLLYDLTAH